MASERQKQAARRNVAKAARAARSRRTIAHIPKRLRTAREAGFQGGSPEEAWERASRLNPVRTGRAV